jgi:hypothetical protein
MVWWLCIGWIIRSLVMWIFGCRLFWRVTLSNLLQKKNQYFSKGEVIFKEGVRGVLLWEIPLWIKVLLVEEGKFHVPSGDMEV